MYPAMRHLLPGCLVMGNPEKPPARRVMVHGRMPVLALHLDLNRPTCRRPLNHIASIVRLLPPTVVCLCFMLNLSMAAIQTAQNGQAGRVAQSSHSTRSRSRWLTTTNADSPKDVSLHQILVVTRRLVPFQTPLARTHWPILLFESGTGSSSFFPSHRSPSASLHTGAPSPSRGLSPWQDSHRDRRLVLPPSCVNDVGFGPPTPDPGIRSGLAHRGRSPVPSAHGTPAAMCVCPSFEKWGMRHGRKRETGGGSPDHHDQQILKPKTACVRIREIPFPT